MVCSHTHTQQLVVFGASRIYFVHLILSATFSENARVRNERNIGVVRRDVAPLLTLLPQHSSGRLEEKNKLLISTFLYVP